VKRLDFGAALAALKQGHRVARSGWNGKGMWIALTPGSLIPSDLARAGAAQLAVKHQEGEFLSIGAHIDMKAVDGSLVVGWLASQTDMLAEDWTVLDPAVCDRCSGKGYIEVVTSPTTFPCKKCSS
jgi:hypothetical protein